MKIERVVGSWSLVVLAGAAVGLFALNCGGGNKVPPSAMCQLGSSCPGTEQCISNLCAPVCVSAKDCDNGAGRCVFVDGAAAGAGGGAGAGGDTGAAGGAGTLMGVYNVCQPPEKKTCALNSDCSPLFCGADLQCRNQCNMDVDCLPGILGNRACAKTESCSAPGVCTTVRLCVDPDSQADKNTYDPNTNTILPATTGGTTGTGATTGAGGKTGTGGKGGSQGNACSSPQTAFGKTAKGDVNPNFTSGVGVRTANQLLIFSAYAGPPVDSSAGGAGGAAANVNLVYVQAFDAMSGASAGPAAPLFQAPDGPTFTVDDVSVSPAGQIALLHASGSPLQLYASFFAPAAAGATAAVAGLQMVSESVPVESSNFSAPHVTWSVASQAFLLSQRYDQTIWQLKIRRFLPNGTDAGGDTNAVPTVTSLSGNFPDEGHAATSGNFVGVLHGWDNGGPFNPYLTILDAADLNTQVGGFTLVSKVDFSGHGDAWLTAGGTASGFVNIFHSASTTYEVFVPITTAGAVVGAVTDPGAGGAGGGNGAGGASGGGAFTNFSFASDATTGHAISDDTGGLGGVGIVLLESTGANLLYVTANGAKHFNSAITSPGGTQVAITNYHGSFGVSLHFGAGHTTWAAATGCTP